MTLSNGQPNDVNDVLNIFHASGNNIVNPQGRIRSPIVVNNTNGLRSVHLHLWGLTSAADGVNYNQAQGSVAAVTSVPMCTTIHIDGASVTDDIGDPNSRGATMFGFVKKYVTPGETTTNVASYTLASSYVVPSVKVGAWYAEMKCAVSRTASAYVHFTYTDATTADSSVETQTGATYVAHTFSNPNPTKKVVLMELYAKTSLVGNPAYIYTYNYSINGWGVNGTTEWSTGVLDLSSLISWTAGEHKIEIVEEGNVGGTIIYSTSINCGF